MEDKKLLRIVQLVFRLTLMVLFLAVTLGGVGLYLYYNPKPLITKNTETNPDVNQLTAEIFTDSIHNATGFIQGEHLDLVISNCTGCHSSKLIIQNRASREGWIGMIKWMQETQNLPDLGENEDKIVDYLATYYSPEEHGRRKSLTDIQWYTLD
jgi:hypothetical protein